MMLDVQGLKVEMMKNGFTQKTLAKELGISPRTFSTRLKTGEFGSKEIEIMVKLLNLENPMKIFFATM